MDEPQGFPDRADESRRASPFGSRWQVRSGPAGYHLFHPGTGLNVLLEELSAPESDWSKAPRQVSIALTNACDLACHFCYAPKYGATLNFERLTGWLLELDANGCLGIGFGGGEPTLYRRLAELCKFAASRTKMAVTLTTHAHHLTAPLMAELAGSIHFVRVSVDGVGATYEATRGRSFEVLLAKLELVRSSTRLGINVVVNSKTIADLSAVARLAARLGAAELLLLPEQPVVRSPGIDPTTTLKLRRWVDRYEGPIPLAVGEYGAAGLPTCSPTRTERGLSAYAHIDASGTLKRNSFDDAGVSIEESGVLAALAGLNAGGGKEAG